MEAKTQKSNRIKDMLSLQKKANIVFWQIIAVFTASLLLLAYIIIATFNRFLLIWPAILGKLEAACGCTNHLTFQNHPFLFSSLIFAGLAFFSFLYLAITKIKKITNSTKKFVNYSLTNKKANFSNKLEKISVKLGLKGKINEIDTKELTVFCYGLKPKICISTQYSEKLSEDELMAVLSHEQYHLINNEPLRIFLIKAIQKILFFIPGLKTLTSQYVTLSELAADEWALKITNNKSSLAAAFYKILNFNESSSSQSSLALPFFNTITDARINKISNSKFIHEYKFLNSKFLFIVFLLITSALSFNFFIRTSKSAMVNFSKGASCSLDQQYENEQCQMKSNPAECSMEKNQSFNDVSSCEL